MLEFLQSQNIESYELDENDEEEEFNSSSSDEAYAEDNIETYADENLSSEHFKKDLEWDTSVLVTRGIMSPQFHQHQLRHQQAQKQ